jgi:hypothetical protein
MKQVFKYNIPTNAYIQLYALLLNIGDVYKRSKKQTIIDPEFASKRVRNGTTQSIISIGCNGGVKNTMV